LHHRLLEDIVSAGWNVDILLIPRLFFVQHPPNEELNCSMEAFFQTTILRSRPWHHAIDKLWEELVKRLFPGCFVMAMEHILKLHKGV
jgi:hypothetical protein